MTRYFCDCCAAECAEFIGTLDTKLDGMNGFNLKVRLDYDCAHICPTCCARALRQIAEELEAGK